MGRWTRRTAQVLRRAQRDISHNVFYGEHPSGGDEVVYNGITVLNSPEPSVPGEGGVLQGHDNLIDVDPLFVAPGTGPSEAEGTSGDSVVVGLPVLQALEGYQISHRSPLINAGTAVADNGGRDFWGGALAGATDIGVHEWDTSDRIAAVIAEASSTEIKVNTTTGETWIKFSGAAALPLKEADYGLIDARTLIEATADDPSVTHRYIGRWKTLPYDLDLSVLEVVFTGR